MKLIVHQAHDLGISGAIARIMRRSGELGEASANVKIDKLSWDAGSGTFQFELTVVNFISNVKVNGAVVLASGYVRIETDDLPLWTFPFVKWEQRKLQTKLSEILK